MQAPVTPLLDQELTTLGRIAGLSLGAYRRAHVEGCVARAITRTGVPGPRSLADRLRHDAHARTTFRRAVLVPVTRMFRDEEEFDLLDRELPQLLGRGRIAAWSAGCASGEEPRSVASLLARRDALSGASLLGTDVFDESLDAARAAADSPALRFEHRDLVSDPPPVGRFDLVLCRNVLIYFAPAAQAAVRRKLVSTMKAGGILMLGGSETIFRPAELGLMAVSRHVYRRAA